MNRITVNCDDLKKKGLPIMLGILAMLGVNYLGCRAFQSVYSFSILTLIVFACCWYLEKWLIRQWNAAEQICRKRMIYSYVVSFLFALTLILGYQLKVNGITDGGFKGKGLSVLWSLCLAVAILPFGFYLFGVFDRLKREETKGPEGPEQVPKRLVFLRSWIVIFLCWVPVFLAYYPAVMAYDYHRQFNEALRGFIWFNPYQPLAHTWTIWLFLNVGELFGSYQVGMACYSIFQMMVLSAACAYSITMMYKLIGKNIWTWVCAALYGIHPFFSVLSVSVTKDVLLQHSSFFLSVC